MAGTYVVHTGALALAQAAAPTLIQIKAGANRPLELLVASIAQGISEISTMESVILVRKTAAATVTAFTPLKLNPNDPTADAAGGAAATGTNATVEGTDGDILENDAFNILSGWIHAPPPEARIIVPVGGLLALKIPVGLSAATTVRAKMVFREFG